MTLTDKEFLAIYWRIDAATPMELNSRDVEEAVAREIGSTADEVEERYWRLERGLILRWPRVGAMARQHQR